MSKTEEKSTSSANSNKTSNSKSTQSSAKKNVLAGMNINKLSNMRIIQKHLVYVIGLSATLANRELLGKFEYFGQYGTILKIVVNKTKAYNPNGPNGPSYSAYISYSTAQEASISILAIDNIEVDDHILRASYGTTKYCTFFLKNLDCPNKDCLYMHHLANESDIINRDEMNSQTNIFYEQQLLAMKLADIFNSDVKKKLKAINTKKKCVLPTTDTIFTKDIVLEQDNEYSNSDYPKYYNKGDYKHKKKYDDYGYYNNKGYSDQYQNDDFYNDQDEYQNYENPHYLHRENSENYTSKVKGISKFNKNKFGGNIDTSDDVIGTVGTGKFISKSKSPITTKKKSITHDQDLKPIMYTTSLSPSNKKHDKDDNKTKENNSQINLTDNKSLNTIKKLYSKREESRFSFAKNNNNLNVFKSAGSNNIATNSNLISKFNSSNANNNETKTKNESLKDKQNETTVDNIADSENFVPDYVSDVICKKISRHTFFKKLEKYFEKENPDYMFVQKHLKPDDSWSKFIISNLKGNK